MSQYLVTKAEFANMAQVSQAMISQLTRYGELQEIVVGKKVNAAHPKALAYLERSSKFQKTDAEGNTIKGTRAQKEAERIRYETESGELPLNIQEFGSWTLQQIANEFGTDSRFSEYLKAVKLQEEIVEKQLRNRERTGENIPRDLVKTHMFGFIDAAFSRLLSDTPRSLAGRIREMVDSGETIERLEEEIRKYISDQIKMLKRQTTKVLKNDK